ncbi:MAG: DNA polymerase III subunit delta [Gammaproteobacteria bacterium]|nr:DNA polymerase III subunit delta [Gammaproteobacteria bacterium]MDH3560281.1 DNA polymerase III subunit delta [Gammaproteobacteria bacterium]
MQINPEQLASRLRGPLAPVYFISGDEPLRVMEAADAVRAQARKQGYDEREVLSVQPGFDWSALETAAGSLSLFSQRRVIDLRLPGGKPGDAGSKALRAYAEQPPEETILLITAGKLEPSARRSKWVQALDQAGVVVFVWPLDAQQFPAWVRARMRQRGLDPTAEAVALLTERVEGNLLACVQEIDKLYLLQGEGPVDAAAVTAMVADSARFDVFSLVDAVLSGDGVRSTRILRGLQGEGVAAPVVLWALTRELRQLTTMADAVAGGEAIPKVLARFRVWQARKPVIGQALGRLSGAVCRDLLRRCALVDRIIKGRAAGNPWDELLQLALLLAGVRVFPATLFQQPA